MLTGQADSSHWPLPCRSVTLIAQSTVLRRSGLHGPPLSSVSYVALYHSYRVSHGGSLGLPKGRRRCSCPASAWPGEAGLGNGAQALVPATGPDSQEHSTGGSA